MIIVLFRYCYIKRRDTLGTNVLQYAHQETLQTQNHYVKYSLSRIWIMNIYFSIKEKRNTKIM